MLFLSAAVQHVGFQAYEAVLPGDADEMLHEQTCDAATVIVLLYREGDFGSSLRSVISYTKITSATDHDLFVV